jgi:hypothetical protein
MLHEEQHYTVIELAALWNLHADTLRLLFRNRAGVLKISRPATRTKRGCTSLTGFARAQVREELSR